MSIALKLVVTNAKITAIRHTVDDNNNANVLHARHCRPPFRTKNAPKQQRTLSRYLSSVSNRLRTCFTYYYTIHSCRLQPNYIKHASRLHCMTSGLGAIAAQWHPLPTDNYFPLQHVGLLTMRPAAALPTKQCKQGIDGQEKESARDDLRAAAESRIILYDSTWRDI